MNSFYNTIGEVGQELAGSRRKAEKQEQRVFELLTEQMTAEDMLQFFDHTPITSIRRALCNLLNAGKIRIVGQRVGMYRKRIFIYEKI